MKMTKANWCESRYAPRRPRVLYSRTGGRRSMTTDCREALRSPPPDDGYTLCIDWPFPQRMRRPPEKTRQWRTPYDGTALPEGPLERRRYRGNGRTGAP